MYGGLHTLLPPCATPSHVLCAPRYLHCWPWVHAGCILLGPVGPDHNTGRRRGADQFYASAYLDDSGNDKGASGLTIVPDYSLTMRAVNKQGSTSPDAWEKSELVMQRNMLQFNYTPPHSNLPYGSASPTVNLMQVSSDGTLYLSSNMQMPSPFQITAYQSATIDSDAKTCIMRLTPDSLKFLSASNGIENTWFSTNSNSRFLNRRCSIFPSLEWVSEQSPSDPLQQITSSNFARLDISYSNRLVFGCGISNTLTNPDYLRVNRSGEVWTLNRQAQQMMLFVNSNAEVQKGTLRITNAGDLLCQSQPIITSAGAIVRRSTPDDASSGVLIRPSGYFSTGGGFRLTRLECAAQAKAYQGPVLISAPMFQPQASWRAAHLWQLGTP